MELKVRLDIVYKIDFHMDEEEKIRFLRKVKEAALEDLGPRGPSLIQIDTLELTCPEHTEEDA